jgi:hypothetical protein
MMKLQSARFSVAQGFKILEDSPEPALDQAEIRVPTAGTWLGLGAGLLVVMAGFVWTIL